MLKHIFIISDIHLGGLPASGRQLGTQLCPPVIRTRLSEFIKYIILSNVNQHIELIINGDFIDFLLPVNLAQPPSSYFSRPIDQSDVYDIKRKLILALYGSLTEEKADSLLRSLSDFLTLGNKLIILIGNHDIELSLPEIRSFFSKCIGKQNIFHFEILFTGEAYKKQNLLIEHGNRYDGWNAVNYGNIRSIISALSRQERTLDFLPPAGSYLVMDVVNKLSSRYGFISLLKPENHALIPLLLTLEPGLINEFRKILTLLPRAPNLYKRRGRPPKSSSFISAPNRINYYPTSDTSYSVNNSIDYFGSENPYEVSIELFSEYSKHLDRTSRVDRSNTEISSKAYAWLNDVRSFWKRFHSRNQNVTDLDFNNLRQAFIRRKEIIEETFDFKKESNTYLSQAIRLIELGNKIVVFGHTHLPKLIETKSRGIYVNTGCWCSRIDLPSEIYDPTISSKDILPFLKDFCDDLMNNRLDKWLNTECNYIKITFSGRSEIQSVGLYNFNSDQDTICLDSVEF